MSNIDGLVNSDVIDILYKLLLEQQINTNIFYVRYYVTQLSNI